MKIALAQLNYTVGDFESNAFKIKEAIVTAKKNKTDLIIFSELALTGYPPNDLLDYPAFTETALEELDKIADACQGITAIIGAPGVRIGHGKKITNAAYIIKDGAIDNFINKTLLPTYDVFDEARYFEPNTDFDIVEVNGVKLAVTICEDIWDVSNLYSYKVHPLDKLLPKKPDLIINISASPYSQKHHNERLEIIQANCLKYNLPLIYVNQTGANTDLIFDGGSVAYNKDGTPALQMPFFEENISYVEFNNGIITTSEQSHKVEEPIARIHDALVLGIKDFFAKQGFKKALLGSSGGIDSAVVNALAVEALGKENVLSVLLPSVYTSDDSNNDAVKLANNLGNEYISVPIKEAVTAFEATLAPHFKGLKADVTEENIQSRSRGVFLMALSNKLGGILLNTSNKSELAVGYSTLYGDLNGGISVLGDVYKTQVYELAKYMNRDREIIPANIITKAPTAELRPNQKDSDSLPEYDILDKILHYFLELRYNKAAIIAKGFNEEVVSKTLHLVNLSEYKRYQGPPILRISDKAFGIGRRVPIVAGKKF